MQPYLIFSDEIDSRSFRNATMNPQELIPDLFGRAEVSTRRKAYRHPRRYARPIGPCLAAETWPDEGLVTLPIEVLVDELVVESYDGDELTTTPFLDAASSYMENPAERLRVEALVGELEAGEGYFREPLLVEGRALINGRYRLLAALAAGVPSVRVCVITPGSDDLGYLLEEVDYVTVVTFAITGWSDELPAEDVDGVAAIGIASIANGDTWLKADITSGATGRTVQAWVYASPEEVSAAVPVYLERLERLGIEAHLLSLYLREMLSSAQLEALYPEADGGGEKA